HRGRERVAGRARRRLRQHRGAADHGAHGRRTSGARPPPPEDDRLVGAVSRSYPRSMLNSFPLPGTGSATVVAPAPAAGPGYWTGGSSAVLDDDGSVVVAYRQRNGHDGKDRTVIA